MMKYAFLVSCMIWRMTGVTEGLLSKTVVHGPHTLTTPQWTDDDARQSTHLNVRFGDNTLAMDENQKTPKVPCRCPPDDDDDNDEWEDAKEAFFATLGGVWALTTVPF
jgi:hypothetical protein